MVDDIQYIYYTKMSNNVQELDGFGDTITHPSEMYFGVYNVTTKQRVRESQINA